MQASLISLKSQPEFSIINACATKIKSSSFAILVTKKLPSYFQVKIQNFPSDKVIFYGMKVGRKLGNAVIRNKIKRRIRHLVSILSKLGYFGLCLVFIPYKGMELISFEELKIQLLNAIVPISTSYAS